MNSIEQFLLKSLYQVENDKAVGSVRISLASPSNIRAWSYGEVKTSDTINYRTLSPEKDGLFCCKIFGPIKNYECLCGRYRYFKYRGIVCEKCGVEVTLSKARRERLGHIELVVPVIHLWFLKASPTNLSSILNVTSNEAEKVIYLNAYIVTEPGSSSLRLGSVISEEEYQYRTKLHSGCFKAETGPEGVKKLLRLIDIESEMSSIRESLASEVQLFKTKPMLSRLRVLAAFKKLSVNPEWMVLNALPILPPDLRPIIPLAEDKLVTSDLNELYKKVINRNNRLRKLIELKAPDIMLKNEKRMLQDSVDALIDNNRKPNPTLGSNKKPLKSLSELLRGKAGRFRQNLLGKRVDYSGRSVITVEPNLKMHQCGIPKAMAVELFKPFIFGKLGKLGLTANVKAARKEIDNRSLAAWKALDEAVRGRYVLLNRAPTLHRLSIQALEPVLVEGHAIQLNPLVCSAFNADFDGDQMAVHVPLSLESQLESKHLITPNNNLTSVSNGRPIMIPAQDMVLGLYTCSMLLKNTHRKGPPLSDANEAIYVQSKDIMDLGCYIRIRIKETIKHRGSFEAFYIVWSTTVGRAILSKLLPANILFDRLNRTLKAKEVADIVQASILRSSKQATISFIEQLMQCGFNIATISGISISIEDMLTPKEKDGITLSAWDAVEDQNLQYYNRLTTQLERYNGLMEIWSKASDYVKNSLLFELSKTTKPNPIYAMVNSGSRGSTDQIKQITGMRGLMVKPDGTILETPITANFREGLTTLQYFISTHGARKGLTDTALKTANSGYLTRRLVDVAQKIVVTEWDCGSNTGINALITLKNKHELGHVSSWSLGRFCSSGIISTAGEVICDAGTLIEQATLETLMEPNIDTFHIRTPLTCSSQGGLCAMCYGCDVSTGIPISIGEAVGVVAAQSIGEPGTQLTMRTFHVGGVASYDTWSNVKAESKGVIYIHCSLRLVSNRTQERLSISKAGKLIILTRTKEVQRNFYVPYGSVVLFKELEHVDRKDVLYTWDQFNKPFIAETDGVIKLRHFVNNEAVQLQPTKTRKAKTTFIIRNAKGPKRPTLELLNPNGYSRKLLLMPGTIVISDVVQYVAVGQVVAYVPFNAKKNRDITGGLMRITDAFETRIQKDTKVLTTVPGFVSVKPDSVVVLKAIITSINTNNSKAEILSLSSETRIDVQNGQYVKKGDSLTDGTINPFVVLKTLGSEVLLVSITTEIQTIYQTQGVNINSKHIEVIVKQMLRYVRVISKGSASFYIGEQLERTRVDQGNKALLSIGHNIISYEYVLQGITKSSLSTCSFISAASFQETTRVLAKAASFGEQDYLLGLKENVIVGRMVPAGTGYIYHKHIKETH
ncbi:DNA-directed RNA polymerase subunit beta' [Candidatus Tremblaya phenacola]|uniref:DNA-directed RNA polymerase subunit beta' n=1 Tax=Candidatus Tremblayella phenacoccinincola TaxID=1010676 RepID=A0A2G0V6Y1_9PROT|nr:DNA-directed RNA polymerase subunit beta' [Candidatus Tremblaya phenacola]PHN16221.1 DNA-directed RNA polymerase subunit beta' [Candidatus Tremblaya phenacola]